MFPKNLIYYLFSKRSPHKIGIAFAAVREGGSVVTWGDPTSGGDCSNVLDKLLSGVKAIYSTGYAFAAVKDTGEVVTWGDSSSGGDSSLVSDSIASNVVKLYLNTRNYRFFKLISY